MKRKQQTEIIADEIIRRINDAARKAMREMPVIITEHEVVVRLANGNRETFTVDTTDPYAIDEGWLLVGTSSDRYYDDALPVAVFRPDVWASVSYTTTKRAEAIA